MLVVYGEGQQRSGRLGATIASHNRSGAYLRAGTIPVNPNTARQVAVRNAVRSITIAWQTILTQLQRDAWDVYAANVTWLNKIGQSINLTGLNHFVRSNTQLVTIGGTRQDTAPAIFNLGAAEPALAVTASAATQLLTVSFDDTAFGWVIEDGAQQWVYTGLPQNPSIKFFGGPYRFVGQISGDLAVPPTSPEIEDSGFVFAADQRIWVRTRIMRADGRLSEFAEVNFLSGA